MAKAEKTVTENGAESQGRVLVAGSINTDLVVGVGHAPAAGETVTGQSFAIFGGGKGANQAVACARSGAITAMFGAVGDDDFGRQRLADLKAEGINCDNIKIAGDAPSGVALIVVESSGENRIAYVPGALSTVTADQADFDLSRFWPDVALTTLELPREALFTLIDLCKQVQMGVIINATPEPAGARDIAVLADILIVNETEACELLDVPVGDHDWDKMAQKLFDITHASVVITLGSKGAVLKFEGPPLTIPAPNVDVVDTTGAGDAFCGAFAAAIARSCSMIEAATFGVAAGAVAVTKAGAQPSMPTLAEIEELLAK